MRSSRTTELSTFSPITSKRNSPLPPETDTPPMSTPGKSQWIRTKRSAPDGAKPKTCAQCRIKRCEKMVEARGEYCFGCDIFPCTRPEHLDKSYRTKYGMSMFENLENIARFGVERFGEKEKERWTCPACGETLCVHRPHASTANTVEIGVLKGSSASHALPQRHHPTMDRCLESPVSLNFSFQCPAGQ